MARRRKYDSEGDYYEDNIGMAAQHLERGVIGDVLAGEELVRDEVKEKYGVGWKLSSEVADAAREVWNRELVRAVSYVSGIGTDDVEMVLYYKRLIDKYCGRFGKEKRRRRSVGKNVTPEKYRKYYSVRISEFTGFEESDIEKFLEAEEDVWSGVMVNNGWVYAMADFMIDHEYPRMVQEFLDDMVEETELDKTVVEIIYSYKGIVSELCGEPG